MKAVEAHKGRTEIFLATLRNFPEAEPVIQYQKIAQTNLFALANSIHYNQVQTYGLNTTHLSLFFSVNRKLAHATLVLFLSSQLFQEKEPLLFDFLMKGIKSR